MTPVAPQPAGTPDAAPSAGRYGVVAIGRNEGDRLERCLRSIAPSGARVVYVDSGSTDGSPALAARLGADVVALDMAIPFTAARARNQGCTRLLALDSGLDYVQFVDGDCEVDSTWLARARDYLDAHAGCVAVAGQRRERHPERSIYNTLCDLDWRSTPGDTTAFGGDVMLRTAAWRDVGGYDPTMIAGEEPDLSIRLRRRGWTIRQTEWPMTLHDANILAIGPWWRRAMRTGYAFGQGADRYGGAPERHWVRERWSAIFWGLALPSMVIGASLASAWLALGLMLAYPAQMLRIAARSGLPPRLALALGFHRVLNKFPEAIGVLKYVRSRSAGTTRIIEYK